MRSSRRQRNQAPETSATMENVGGRVSNSNSASDARPSPSPSRGLLDLLNAMNSELAFNSKRGTS